MATSSTRKLRIFGCLTSVDPSELTPEDQECDVCNEAFQNPKSAAHTGYEHEQPVKLQCQHTFGEECIIAWLKEHENCPKCRSVILPLEPAEPASEENFIEEATSPLSWWRQARAEDLQRLRDGNRDIDGRLVRFLEEHFSADEVMSFVRSCTWEQLVNEPQIFFQGPLASWIAEREAIGANIDMRTLEVLVLDFLDLTGLT